MKIRNGFVSNSSSSSFLIYGCQVSQEVANKAEGMKDVKFDVVYGEYDSYYLGLSWRKVKDDQTGKEFKESVEKSIKEAFEDEDFEFGTFSEAWYDG